jgi:chromatin modification-related protein VID21
MLQQQQQQQPQPNGLGRPSGTGLPATQGVPQIRNQVNISQQQRLPATMGTGNTRLSPQQMLQAQAAQARAIQVAAAQAQAQAAQNAAANMNGMGPSINNSHISPPYNNRATTSSPLPHSSPSHPSTTLSNATGSPRPPSAQSQGNMGPAPQVPGNAMPRQAGNMGHFFPMVPNMQNIQGIQNMQNVPTANFTPEHMEHALRLQSLVQASNSSWCALPLNTNTSTESTGNVARTK